MSAERSGVGGGGGRGGIAGIGLGWWFVAVVASAAGFVTVAALGSTIGEVYPLQLAGLTVAAVSAAIAIAIPFGLASVIVRTLRNRGRATRRGLVTAATVAGFNLLVVVLAQGMGPIPVKDLWVDRGTWVWDASTGHGPFGPAALPELGRQLDAIQSTKRLAEASPAWCSETAGGFAAGLADGMAAAAPLPLAQTLHAILDRYGVDPKGTFPDDLDGVALLADVTDVVAASGPAVDLPPQAPVDPTPASIGRKRVTFATPGWEARYERGRWTWCTGSLDESIVRGQVYATAIREEAARTPIPAAGGAVGPWDGAVRAALQRVVLGRSGWLLAVSTFDPDWAESLTRTAAAAQGEHVRAWCEPAAAVDPGRAGAVAGVVSRWTLPAAGQPIGAPVQSLLEAQGRRYLQDVLAACAPVAGDRQVREAAAGVSIPDAQRRRWAELEARTLASAAVLTDDGTGGVKVEVDGRTVRAVQEDGAWRIDWRD